MGRKKRKNKASHEQLFGELRALVHGTPAQHTWASMLKQLRNWPDVARLRSEVIPYLARNLDPWPSSLRQPHSNWLEGNLPDAHLPILALCRSLRITNHPKDVHHYLKVLDHMVELDELVISRYLDEHNLKHVLEAAALDQLRALCIYRLGSFADLAPWLAERSWWSTLERLEMLHVSGSPCAHWDTSRVGDNMRHLELTGPYVSPHVLGLLEREPQGVLEVLILRSAGYSGANHRNDAFDIASPGPWLPQLRQLTLQGLGLSDGTLLALRGQGALEKLELLNLEGNYFGARSLIPVLSDVHNLHTLYLGGSTIDSGVIAAMRSSELPLRALGLRATGLRGEHIGALCDGMRLDQLSELDLSHNELAAGELRGLLGKTLPALTTLNVAGSTLGRLAIAEIAEAPWFEQLETLVLGGSSIGDDAANLILDDERFHRLDTLRLIDTTISDWVGYQLNGEDSPLRRSAAQALTYDLPSYYDAWE